MKLQKILNRLKKKHPKKIDLSLNRTFNLLKKLGNPQDKLKNVITVCGTNGKFSSIDDFLTRVDPTAASAIDQYICWGSVDFDFFSQVKELKNKMIKLGNIRSDLLGSYGKFVYKDTVSALQSLYGSFLFFSDNFCVERWNSNYILRI